MRVPPGPEIMKVILNLIVGLLLALGTASAVADYSETVAQQFAGRSDVPVPVHVVSPTLGSEALGTELTVHLTVNEGGVPTDISVDTADRLVAERIIAAVRQWRFKPALLDGEPVARRVRVPMSIVEGAPAMVAGR